MLLYHGVTDLFSLPMMLQVVRYCPHWMNPPRVASTGGCRFSQSTLCFFEYSDKEGWINGYILTLKWHSITCSLVWEVLHFAFSAQTAVSRPEVAAGCWGGLWFGFWHWFCGHRECLASLSVMLLAHRKRTVVCASKVDERDEGGGYIRRRDLNQMKQ